MKISEKITITSIINNILFYFLICGTIVFLLFKINIELNQNFNISFSKLALSENFFFRKIKNCNTIGWFNLKEYEGYDKGADNVFLSFQYMIAPTILENYSYNKKIICYFTSPIQLAAFCKKNKKYRLIRKNILTNFALLERID